MKSLILICILFVAIFTQNLFAFDMGSCTQCHGVNGESKYSLYPSLKGQKKTYLVKQLKDFKSGKRADQIMSSIAKTLSSKDIEKVSEFFSSK